MNLTHLSDSPTIRKYNKENSPYMGKYQPLISQASLDQDHLTHKIMNEMLNSGTDYLSDQMNSLNNKITQYQQNIKMKITTLLNESQSFDQSFMQKQLTEYRNEEQSLNSLQQEIDRQQNQVYDYYEIEFNKLKHNYENTNKEYQQYQQERTKLHESYSQMLETKAALQEDLNARLLQRAELVGQKEELEEYVDMVANQNPQLFEIVQIKFQLAQKIQQIKESQDKLTNMIQRIEQQKEEKKKQLQSYHQITMLEVQVHQANQKLKLLKNKLVPIQKSLNLPHPDTLFNDFLTQNSNNINPDQTDFQQRLSSFIQAFRNQLFRTGNQGSNWAGMKEFVNQLEQFILSAFQQKAVSTQLNELKSVTKQYGEEIYIQNEICNLEFQVEVKKQQIKELEDQKEIIQYQIENVKNQLDDRITNLVQDAFKEYQDVNYDQMEEIKEQIGQQEYEELLQQTYEQLNDIINKQERDQFDNTTKLMDKYHIQDQSIKTNIYMVDSQILPQLKNIVQQLSKVKKDIEKQTYNEKPYQDKLQKLEQDIQLLEQEFKVKIQQFQIQEQDLNNKLNRIKEQIDTCQDQILLRVKPNKALLEQEILQLNNVLTSLQDQKQQLEGISNKSPPTRKSSCGILAISKSLNQFAKLRKQDIVSSSNQIVKGITPTKDTANLYLINKYSQNKSSSKQDNRPKQNFSMKAIK